jgi:hypothetical protein
MAVVSIKNKTKSGSLLVGNAAFIPTDYESIATVTVGSGGSANVEFTSIPGTYSHLQIRAILRDTASAANTMVRINVNGVTDSAKYSWHDITADGSTVYANNSQGQGDTYFRTVRYPGATSTASAFGAFVTDVLDYANTNKYKTFRTLGGYDANGSGWPALTSAVYMETTAITSIKLTSGSTSFAQYSHFALYGIKGA